MGSWALVITALVVCSYHFAIGKSTFRKCSVYAIGETKPPVQDGMGRYCRNSEGPIMIATKEKPAPPRKMETYCLDYKCPALDCDGADIVKEAGKCDRCKGDCEWAGRIVKNGKGGVCSDGCNRCGCTNGVVSSSTRMGCPAAFCF